ncbi:ferritin-like domain-containing protein [Pararoseomonas indoligenes]|uniref:Ferritin-like domain-containing protein n=1 Tax=Roseomonas indoligenes TaxID=2820811 RepID=A0A940S8K6_9PROT|nr:ferritin-like domain-containing protein [Pararoseomonas indoligenes]MBP0496199.1 ferritin-like domain-containing protein [Pararoseomonas indoligenes]
MQQSYQDLYLTGLVNARALETQAIELLTRQVERIESYPEIADALRRHAAESEQQRVRLDTILESLGSSNSAIKDFVTGLMGNMAALAHAPMQDEILKNTLANYAFEHFEIASYKSLLVLADLAGDASAPTALRQSLQEEERMAQWCADTLEPTVRKFATLAAQGAQAGI